LVSVACRSQSRPRSIEALREVEGIGDAKVAAFGKVEQRH